MDCFIKWLERYGQHVTKLSLSSFPQPLQELRSCPNLRSLQIFGSSVLLGPTAFGASGVLEGCTKLTRLQLHCSIIDVPEGGVVHSLSRLVRLRHLDLPYPTGLASLSSLRHLTHLRSMSEHHSLTALRELCMLAGRESGNRVIGPSSVPGMAFPDALTRLELGSPVEAGPPSGCPWCPLGCGSCSFARQCGLMAHCRT